MSFRWRTKLNEDFNYTCALYIDVWSGNIAAFITSSSANFARFTKRPRKREHDVDIRQRTKSPMRYKVKMSEDQSRCAGAVNAREQHSFDFCSLFVACTCVCNVPWARSNRNYAISLIRLWNEIEILHL